MLLLLHQPEQVLIVHLLLEASRLFKGLALHLLDLVRELQSLLTGEELDDGVGVEDVARVDLGHGVIIALWCVKNITNVARIDLRHFVIFILVCIQTIMAPALKKETAGKCLKEFCQKKYHKPESAKRPDSPSSGILLVVDLHKLNVVPSEQEEEQGIYVLAATSTHSLVKSSMMVMMTIMM